MSLAESKSSHALYESRNQEKKLYESKKFEGNNNEWRDGIKLREDEKYRDFKDNQQPLKIV